MYITGGAYITKKTIHRGLLVKRQVLTESLHNKKKIVHELLRNCENLSAPSDAVSPIFSHSGSLCASWRGEN